MTKHLVFAAAIAGLSFIAFGSIASAAYADPVQFPDGTCWEPGSNPPNHVPCDSPYATTPATTIAFVPVATTDDPTAVTAPPLPTDTPIPVIPLPDGTCWQPGSNPPLHVDCDTTRATTPYVPGEQFADDPPSSNPDAPASTPTTVAVADTAATSPTVEPETSPARAFVAPRHLPATGSPTAIPVLVGGIALLVGAALLVAGRRASI